MRSRSSRSSALGSGSPVALCLRVAIQLPSVLAFRPSSEAHSGTRLSGRYRVICGLLPENSAFTCAGRPCGSSVSLPIRSILYVCIHAVPCPKSAYRQVERCRGGLWDALVRQRLRRLTADEVGCGSRDAAVGREWISSGGARQRGNCTYIASCYVFRIREAQLCTIWRYT